MFYIIHFTLLPTPLINADFIVLYSWLFSPSLRSQSRLPSSLLNIDRSFPLSIISSFCLLPHTTNPNTESHTHASTHTNFQWKHAKVICFVNKCYYDLNLLAYLDKPISDTFASNLPIYIYCSLLILMPHKRACVR